MGVKGLWKVLGPVGKKSSLFELSDKTVAIDLSCWVCENKIVGEKYVPMQTGMHLRTSMLLMINVTPIFVLDGKPPDLKKDTLAKRKQIRYKQQKVSLPKDAKSNKTSNRSRLKFLLKQCKSMLEMMGLTCLESEGEGEALCAQLNKNGIVDGVITQDSDVFLYGAKVVYRNFTLQGNNGSIEIFKMEDIQEKLNLSLEKLVAISLLCGCDYDDHGIIGVGKERALKYLSSFKDDKILDRLRQWKTDKVLDMYESQKVNCTICSHPGKLKEHKKQGCNHCGTDHNCKEDKSLLSYRNLDENQKDMINLELYLRKKALENLSFPEEGIINEFLEYKQPLPKFKAAWRQPRVTNFVQFTSDLLEWELEYAFQKILPLSTRWQLLNNIFSDFVPDKILKKRTVKGVPSFEILWSINNENLNAFIECSKTDWDENSTTKIITVEPQMVIMKNAGTLYDDYNCELEKEKIMKKEEKKKGKIKRDKPKESKKKKNNDFGTDDNTLKFEFILKEMTALSIDKDTLKESKIDLVNLPENAQTSESFSSSIINESGEVAQGYSDTTQTLDLCDLTDENLSRFDNLNNTKSIRGFNSHGCSSFNCHICDDSTLDYEIDESIIVESILARKNFN